MTPMHTPGTLPATLQSALAPVTPAAETLALIARFIDLERRRRFLHRTAGDNAEREAAVASIQAAQETIVEHLEELPIEGPAAVSALAAAVLVWWPSFLEEIESLDGRLIRLVFGALAPTAVAEADWMADNVAEPTAEDLAWARMNGGEP